MGYLEEFGFKVFKMRNAKSENEFLIYDIVKNSYNTYNEKRAIKFLFLEFKEKEIDIIDFASKTLDMDIREIKPLKLLIYWIDEELKLIDDIGYKPIDQVLFERDNKIYFNTFKTPKNMIKDNFILSKPMSYEELKTKAPYHHQLFYNLHNKDEDAIKNTLLKLADKIKYPDVKAQDCIIFYPGEGSGKGIFYKYIISPIFENYAKKVLMNKLSNDFNGFIKEPLVLVLEEGKRDLELVEILKEITTEGSVLINEKGKPQTQEEIYFLTFVFSNHMNPIDLGKRRGSYHLTHSLGKDVDKSQSIGVKLCENLPKETIYLLQYLHNLEFTHQEALRPFNTKAKEQVNDLNKNVVELFYDFIISYKTLEESLTFLQEKRHGDGTFKLIIEDYKNKDTETIEKYISKDIFKEAYNNFCNLEGFRSNLIRHNKDIVQLWALFKLPEDAHRRLVVKRGKNRDRRIDHIRAKDIGDHIANYNKEVLNENE